MRINERVFYYALYDGTTPITDADGYETGEKRVAYQTAVAMRANISPARGQDITMPFGNLENYDKVIITNDMSCPIDENTVLFIDTEPSYDAQGNPRYDYTVRRVAKSINTIAIAVSKVVS